MMRDVFAVGPPTAVAIFCLADVFPPTHTITMEMSRYARRVAFNVVSGTPAWLINTISAVFYKCDYQKLVFAPESIQKCFISSTCVWASLWIHSSHVVYWSINPVVLVFVSNSVNSSSNSLASKGLVLSGTFSDFHPKMF